MSFAKHLSQWTLTLVLLSGASAEAIEPVKRYAVIVSNNESLDEGVAPLAYAVDDGAKYQELFQAMGAQTALLARFDADSARRHPDAAGAAISPRRAEVLAAIERQFSQMRADHEAGLETHFYFLYTGHGSLGANHEGYVNLADSRLTRGELYREVLARSPATFNHLILDACYAYYFVLKRGDGEKEGDYRAAIRDFLRAEELSSYPNTGVLLASSTNSETHEWSRWEAGIFSHELRSGLLGPADVDRDGRVTYDEAAAFVEAANSAIDVPRARLRVFYRAPLSRRDVPLLDLRAGHSPVLEVGPENAGQFYLEDSAGVRVADLHPSSEQGVRVALVGKAPFWLRSYEREALLPEQPTVAVAQLDFAPLSERVRGSVERSFRKNLFLVPFGISFYRDAMAERAWVEDTVRLDLHLARPAVLGSKAAWGIGALSAAALLGAAGGAAYALAADSHAQYLNAKTPAGTSRARETTVDRVNASRVLAGVAGAAAVAGAALLILEWRENASSASVTAMPTPSGVTASISGSW
ncbi:MAG TPA: hypothetical protein VGK67_33370 [Myxococcales bacterium]